MSRKLPHRQEGTYELEDTALAATLIGFDGGQRVVAGCRKGCYTDTRRDLESHTETS